VDCNSSLSAGAWKAELHRLLPHFGHRNWIVIADSAYPAQSNPGIETVVTDANHLEVLDTVLRGIAGNGHIRANVYIDQELELVPEADAPGVNKLRLDLDRLLANSDRHELHHEQIIAKLDQAGSLFRILILKTTLRIPYTSIFLELDCGYWNADAESRLRAGLADPERSTIA
jgi:hypothetical protein